MKFKVELLPTYWIYVFIVFVSLRAKTNCDVFSLSKKDLDEVLKLYPRIQEQVTKIAKERQDAAKARSQARIQVYKPDVRGKIGI